MAWHIRVRNFFLRIGYRYVVKPVLFWQDPENVHDRAVGVGGFLGKFAVTRALTMVCFGFSDTRLSQHILGMRFSNPVGLAAGFDKNGWLTQIMPAVGFGFTEVGSVTGNVCSGNPKPRLWRLKKSKSLLVYYGLVNDGAAVVARRLRKLKFSIPVGISIAKTNSPETVTVKQGIADYVKAFTAVHTVGTYLSVNISCPNAFGGEPFTDAKKLDQLLRALDKIKTTKPIFLKLSPDLSIKEVDAIIAVSEKHRVHGFICTNLTKKRDAVVDETAGAEGGVSGKALAQQSTELITHVYKKTQGRYVIIGCGGISCAEDAYEKIKAGASLLQLITGMIYEGPQTVSAINEGLVRLLKRDGYTCISEAIGKH